MPPSPSEPIPPTVLESQASARIEPFGRPTPARVRVFAVLLAAPHALSHAEIEAAFAPDEAPDRVTLYRVLDWLETNGLVHRIASEDRAWRFNASGPDSAGHAHFHCMHCGQVFCLHALQPAFAFTLPPGYVLERAELRLQGRCPTCAGMNAAAMAV